MGPAWGLTSWAWYRGLCAVCLGIAAYMIWSFLQAGLIADDSYIVARYAANFVNKGELAYNLGERVNAITSPLLLAVYILLTFCFPDYDPVFLYCRIAILCFVITCLLAIMYLRSRPPGTLLIFSVFFALSPFHSFWLTGGLETPILSLLAFFFYLTFVLTDDQNLLKRSWVFGLTFGLGVLTRYDSILLLLPIICFLLNAFLKKRDFGRAAGLLTWSAVPPGVWGLFCHYYYGSFFPTSIVKIDSAMGGGNLLKSAIVGSMYVYEFGIYTGFLFAGCALLLGREMGSNEASLPHEGRHSWRLRLGVAGLGGLLFLAYCCLFSAVHMMYAYRMLVPLIPVGALLVALGAEGMWPKVERTAGSLIVMAGIIFISILSLNLVNFAVLLNWSINPSRVGEFRGKWEIQSYFKELDLAGQAIQKHWAPNGGTPGSPVVASPNEGYFAYKYLDWIVVRGRLTDRTERLHVDYYVVEEDIHDHWFRNTSHQVIHRGNQYPRVTDTVTVSRVLVLWSPREKADRGRSLR